MMSVGPVGLDICHLAPCGAIHGAQVMRSVSTINIWVVCSAYLVTRTSAARTRSQLRYYIPPINTQVVAYATKVAKSIGFNRRVRVPQHNKDITVKRVIHPFETLEVLPGWHWSSVSWPVGVDFEFGPDEDSEDLDMLFLSL